MWIVVRVCNCTVCNIGMDCTLPSFGHGSALMVIGREIIRFLGMSHFVKLRVAFRPSPSAAVNPKVLLAGIRNLPLTSVIIAASPFPFSKYSGDSIQSKWHRPEWDQPSDSTAKPPSIPDKTLESKLHQS